VDASHRVYYLTAHYFCHSAPYHLQQSIRRFSVQRHQIQIQVTLKHISFMPLNRLYSQRLWSPANAGCYYINWIIISSSLRINISTFQHRLLWFHNCWKQKSRNCNDNEKTHHSSYQSRHRTLHCAGRTETAASPHDTETCCSNARVHGHTVSCIIIITTLFSLFLVYLLHTSYTQGTQECKSWYLKEW